MKCVSRLNSDLLTERDNSIGRLSRSTLQFTIPTVRHFSSSRHLIEFSDSVGDSIQVPEERLTDCLSNSPTTFTYNNGSLWPRREAMNALKRRNGGFFQ